MNVAENISRNSIFKLIRALCTTLYHKNWGTLYHVIIKIGNEIKLFLFPCTQITDSWFCFLKTSCLQASFLFCFKHVFFSF